MTKQHTPGPWNAQHVFGTCYSVQCAGGQYHVGTIRGKQNARLIAASPDLLDALKHLEHNALKSGANMGLALDVARAAIAKATGATE